MEKKTQDLAWACLPKEVRKEIRAEYQNAIEGSELESFLQDFFGHHNLTSDTEPEELIFAPKWRVEQYLKGLDVCIDISDLEQVKALRNALGILFGDKCLPVTPIPPNSGELKSQEAENEPYTEPETKDNMEEKEFNLCKILQGREGERIFLPGEGECEIVSIRKNAIEFTRNGIDRFGLYNESLRLGSTGFAYAYPSEESFITNPLNARKAWLEWSEARKPKRWRAKSSSGVAVSECEGYWEGYSYWYVTSDGVIAQDEEMNCNADNLRYKYGNYFRTEEEANQAADGIREYLKKFHEEHIRQ